MLLIHAEARIVSSVLAGVQACVVPFCLNSVGQLAGALLAYAEAGIGNQGTSKLATGFQGGADGFTYGLNLADERSDGFDVYPGNTFSPNPDKDGYSNTSLGLNAGYKTGIHRIDASLLYSRLRTHYDQSPPPFDDYDVVKNTTGSLRWQADRKSTRLNSSHT